MQAALGPAKQVFWLLVESDSSDNTLAVLEELAQTIPGFNYLSLGGLCGQMPERTVRIAHCRNAYVRELRRNSEYNDVDYVLVADFDGVNHQLTSSAVASCWLREGWDMCAANPKGPYYDVWALRHKEWSPNDCWAQYRYLNRIAPDREKHLRGCVFSRMIHIPEDNGWIEVDSAFGGLAIYRKHCFATAEYSGRNEAGEEICEHVPFHGMLRQQGARLFINPRLINTGYTEQTREMLWHRTAQRRVRAFLRRMAVACFGAERFARPKSTHY